MAQQDGMQYEPEKQIIRKEICKQYQSTEIQSYINLHVAGFDTFVKEGR